MFWKNIFVIILFSLGSVCAFAEDTETSAYHYLDEMVVTASPVRDSMAGDISVTKTIIHKAEIDRMHAFDVGDVLKQIPGVFLVNEGIFGNRTVGQGRIKIRGSNAKVLIDGRPVNM